MKMKANPTASSGPSGGPGSAQALFDALLKATTHRTKRANIERVWLALEALRKRKVNEFGPANVAREISRSLPGTPTYQSIRNRTGAHFRQLISAYEAEHGIESSRTNDDADIEIVRALREQPRLQLRYSRILEFNKAFQLQIKLLLEQIAKLSTSSRQAGSNPPPGGVVVAFDTVEIYAVRKFLDKLDSRAWEVGPRGKLLDETKDELAPIGFVPALRKISPVADKVH
jgi:hypothetical protein